MRKITRKTGFIKMAETAEQIVTHRQAKILVIDDHESARNLLKRRLAIYGYEVYPQETLNVR